MPNFNLENLDLIKGKIEFRSNLSSFYEELQDQLRMSVSIGQFLASCQTAAQRRGQSKSFVYKQMRYRLNIGGTLSDALRGFVPPSNLLMIQSGEQVGRLMEGVSCAHIANKSVSAMQAMMFRVLLPAILLFLGLFGVYLMFGIMIVPEFLSIVKLEQMGGSFKIAYYLAETAKNWWYLIVPALIGSLVVIFWSISNWTGPLRRMADRLPPYSIYRQYLSAVVLINFSGLLRSNVALRDAIILMHKDGSPYLRMHLNRMQINLARGGTLATSMDTGLIQADLIDYLVSFEVSGKLEEVMKKIGFENLERALTVMEVKLKVQAASIKAFTGVFLGWLFFDTFSFGQVVSSAARMGTI